MTPETWNRIAQTLDQSFLAFFFCTGVFAVFLTRQFSSQKEYPLLLGITAALIVDDILALLFQVLASTAQGYSQVRLVTYVIFTAYVRCILKPATKKTSLWFWLVLLGALAAESIFPQGHLAYAFLFLLPLIPLFGEVREAQRLDTRIFAVSAALLLLGIGAEFAAGLRALPPLPWEQAAWSLVMILNASFLVRRFKRKELKISGLEKNLQHQQADMARLVQAYSRFVPTQFLTHLKRDSIRDIQLGDQVQRTMTILFSDIRNFTDLSEKLSPQDNFNLLNQLLSALGPMIRQHQGFIDKYIGDAIMALFDGTVDQALAAAVDMQLAVGRFNASRAHLDVPPIHIGIGLHRGPLMLGIIGEAGRMDSTVIADAVNLASRIESLTKHYNCHILVSRPTFEEQISPEAYTTRPVDLVKVKGKTVNIELLEIIDSRFDRNARNKIELAADLAVATAAYRNGALDLARQGFQALAYKDPADMLYVIYRKRIEDLLLRGLPDDWDGSINLDTK